MKVEKIYLDLKEAKEETKFWQNVWVLESEAFKDPITLQIGYSDKDRDYIEHTKQETEKQVKEANSILVRIENKIQEYVELINKYREELNKRDEKIQELEKKLESSEREKIKVLQYSEMLREESNKHSEQIINLENKVNELEIKATKQPMVYNGQSFVSWNWLSALTTIQTYDGDYSMIWMTKIVEKNEYVENEDVEMGAINIHVQDWIYIPEFELKGTNQMDTPTATVDRTFTLIPC